MKLLLDTRLLLWAAGQTERLPAAARGLINNGYLELAISGEDAVAALPPIHRDPFDRLLLAQSAVEGILLLTADPIVACYPGPVRQV